jgi:hypothetical protein
LWCSASKLKGGWRKRKTVQYPKQEGGWETLQSCDPPILKEQVGGRKKKRKFHPLRIKGWKGEKKKLTHSKGERDQKRKRELFTHFKKGEKDQRERKEK